MKVKSKNPYLNAARRQYEEMWDSLRASETSDRRTHIDAMRNAIANYWALRENLKHVGYSEADIYGMIGSANARINDFFAELY